jgi:HK97 family phage prohead protease
MTNLEEAFKQLKHSIDAGTRELREERLAREMHTAIEHLRLNLSGATSRAMERYAAREVFEMKSAAGVDGTFSGYGALFGDEHAHPTSAWQLTSDWIDVLEKGCFERTLTEHKSRGTLPACCLQHDLLAPIGAFREVVEDYRGLYVEGELATKTVKGSETWELAKIGGLNGLSIGFIVTKAELDQATKTRTITSLDLLEISFVTIPAIAEARAST